MSLTTGLWRPSEAQRAVVAGAAVAFGLDPEDLTSRRKHGDRPRARFVAVWALRARWPELSRPQLCVILGWTDQSTATHAFQRAEIEYKRDLEFRRIADDLAGGRAPPPVRIAEKLVASLLAAPPLPAWRLRPVKPKNELDADDYDALKRSAGTDRLLAALRREHPNRCLAA